MKNVKNLIVALALIGTAAIYSAQSNGNYRAFVNQLVLELKLEDVESGEEDAIAEEIAPRAKDRAVELKLNLEDAAEVLIAAFRERFNFLNGRMGARAMSRTDFEYRMNNVSNDIYSVLP